MSGCSYPWPDAGYVISLHFDESAAFAEVYRCINPRGNKTAIYCRVSPIRISHVLPLERYHHRPKSPALVMPEASVFIYFNELPISLLVSILKVQLIHQILEFKMTDTK